MVVPDQLSTVLNEPLVARLASPRSFERGEVYLEMGHVGPLRASAERVAATVQGTESYSVELSTADGRLRFACSCPVGVDGAFCKHCVAVALSWLRDHGPPMPTLDDARAHLETLPPEALVELLIDHAHDDEGLARKLLLVATRPASGESADMGSLRALIDQTFAHHGFVHYREVYGYVRGIEETIDVLDGLLAEERAAEVVELAEYALAVAERALDHIDDSDGQMRDVIERLEALHLYACQRAAPDPVALAERLFTRELEGEWDVFHQAVARYAGVLGHAGLARYRDLAGERWASVPKLLPGDASRGHYDSGRFRITYIMEALAELSGSLADQIAVRERDLSIGYRFLQIGELCRSNGDDDAALEWAERGMAAFADDPDARLRAFLITEYRRRGRTAEALDHSLAAFHARPTLDTYRELATDARALGQWEGRHEAALALLRQPEPDSPAIPRHSSLHERGCSELVRVYLWEGDPDTAWQAAQEGGCTRDLWLELADLRRTDHPEDALDVYRQHVEDVIAHKDKRAYQEAVRLIDDTMRPLFDECGRSDDFAAYVDEVRTTHKAKRNLMKLMGALETANTAR
jgi:uncharacterized Zn finger protein